MVPDPSACIYTKGENEGLSAGTEIPRIPDGHNYHLHHDISVP